MMMDTWEQQVKRCVLHDFVHLECAAMQYTILYSPTTYHWQGLPGRRGYDGLPGFQGFPVSRLLYSHLLNMHPLYASLAHQGLQGFPGENGYKGNPGIPVSGHRNS